MVNTTAASSQLNTSTERPPANSQDFWNETLQESKAPVYDWTPEIQGILLSSLSYGSFLAPIPTGYVAGVFGAKYVVGAGLLISSILTLFIPLAADAGVALLIVLRVIQGIAQSGILSALPFVFGCVCIILGGLLADFLLSRKILQLVTIRKLFTAIGVLVSSGILVPLPWVRSSRITTMAFLVLSSVFCSLCDSGALINFLDIAPRHLSCQSLLKNAGEIGYWTVSRDLVMEAYVKLK
ncbi:Putative small intestine sodium-dependent phosphate transport protein [Cricetulus griseus]|uniref:Putative small intestine sodium-dependent phosphate transport protein n=1 Tax=Cricetulus griseus TaxID=10029 RepID=G3HDV3_CRIGR|nr:Putative small intestine sodium-dependent phosphate transport protein [Cricetulus griseus]